MYDNTHFSDEPQVADVPEWTDEQYKHWRATGETPEVAKLKAEEDAARRKAAAKAQRKLNLSNPAHPVMPHTFGSSFDQEIDGVRLSTQLEKLYDFMVFCQSIPIWVSLAEIEEQTGIPQSSASAQLRHLRKVEFGSHIIEKRRRSTNDGGHGGTYEYFLVMKGTL